MPPPPLTDPDVQFPRIRFLSGERRTAAIASLIATTLLNGLDQEAWLRHVLERIAEHPVNRVAQLLPWNCAGAVVTQHGIPIAA